MLGGMYLVTQILSPWNPAAAIPRGNGPSGPAGLRQWLSGAGIGQPGGRRRGARRAGGPGMPPVPPLPPVPCAARRARLPARRCRRW